MSTNSCNCLIVPTEREERLIFQSYQLVSQFSDSGKALSLHDSIDQEGSSFGIHRHAELGSQQGCKSD